MQHYMIDWFIVCCCCCRFFKKSLDITCMFIPQLIFLTTLFIYLCVRWSLASGCSSQPEKQTWWLGSILAHTVHHHCWWATSTCSCSNHVRMDSLMTTTRNCHHAIWLLSIRPRYVLLLLYVMLCYVMYVWADEWNMYNVIKWYNNEMSRCGLSDCWCWLAPHACQWCC